MQIIIKQIYIMKYKILIITALLFPSVVSMAQSTYEIINAKQNPIKVGNVENLTVDAQYQEWLSLYEKVGYEINEVSEQYQREVDKRGYPKKKTVLQKIKLVEQYIHLLKQQRDSPTLNQNLDFKKVENKISLWENQLEGLKFLLSKI